MIDDTGGKGEEVMSLSGWRDDEVHNRRFAVPCHIITSGVSTEVFVLLSHSGGRGGRRAAGKSNKARQHRHEF